LSELESAGDDIVVAPVTADPGHLRGCRRRRGIPVALHNWWSGHVGPVLRRDTTISDGARRFALAHPAWSAIMATVTVTISTTVVGSLAAAACAALLAVRRVRSACFVAAASLLTLSVPLLIVNAIARPRPTGRLGRMPAGAGTGQA
jgi:hypothetical protein